MNKFLFIASMILVVTLGTSCGNGETKSDADQQKEDLTSEIDLQQIRFFKVETNPTPIMITLSGRIRADDRLELFPEVPGVVMKGNRLFRGGVSYQKGEILIQLDNSEATLQLQSSRSKFKTLVSALMADIKLDYPDKIEPYEEWFNTLTAEKSVPPIPDFGETTQRFLESKGVYEAYYSIKSAEERLEKFTIRAPFSGILSAANAEPGRVVGPQFHLGTLVDPSLFILNASVDPGEAEWIRPGMTMEVMNQNQTESFRATIARVNPSVEPASQQVYVYLEVPGENLREGMYLEGEIETQLTRELAKIPKPALLRTISVLAKRDGQLLEVPVEIEYLERSYIWVSGLQNGDEIVEDVSEPVSGRIIK